MNKGKIPHPFFNEALAAQKINLIRLRFYAGLTQSELAIACKISQGRMSEYELGKILAQPPTLKIIAATLKCEIKDIIQPPKRDREARSTSDSALE